MVLQRFRSLALFAVSGCLALLVDIGVLYLCKPWLGVYGGRALSFLCAATFTWLFNRTITFKGPRPASSVLAEYLAYLSTMLLGGAINYGAYALSLRALDIAWAQPALSVAIGSLVSMGFNFVSARRVIQGRPR
jgi:putative flippase GtrA